MTICDCWCVKFLDLYVREQRKIVDVDWHLVESAVKAVADADEVGDLIDPSVKTLCGSFIYYGAGEYNLRGRNYRKKFLLPSTAVPALGSTSFICEACLKLVTATEFNEHKLPKVLISKQGLELW